MTDQESTNAPSNKAASEEAHLWAKFDRRLQARIREHYRPPQLIYRLTVSGTSAKIVDTIKFARLTGVGIGTSWIQPSRNIMVFVRISVAVWKYPAGGRRLQKLHGGIGEPLYIATVAVPASK